MNIDQIQPPLLDAFPPKEAGRVLKKTLKALQKEGIASLPELEGIEFEPLARWLFRIWSQEKKPGAAPGGPLVFLDPRHLEQEEVPLPSFWEVARGGLLAITAPLDPLPEELKKAQEAGELAILLPSRDEVVALDPRFRLALLHFDDCHETAVDPALRYLRRSLLANCRSASPVHLRGEPATGKRALALWAHRILDDEPLAEIRGQNGLPEEGRWNLFDEISSLGKEQRHALRRLLDSYHTPRTTALPGPEGPRPRHRAFEPIIGTSQPLTRVLHTVEGLAQSPLTMLLLGEPGVGKESLAQAIHEVSGRPGPFIAIDMGALAENLAESELFGHIKGAFTGADRERPGAFRAAQGGTLFLDEIGNLSPTLQMRLLRVLQERQVLPVGADKPVDVDVRVVAATNADLRLMVMQGIFRQDLLSRLSAATVEIPPLRERIGDLHALAHRFLTQMGFTLPQTGPLWTDEVEEIFRTYPWPGNIRELSNTIGYATALSKGTFPIEASHLGPLSPQRLRPTPLITTSSGDGLPTVEGLSGALQQLMTLTTLTVPPYRERSRESRRLKVLEILHGRPITLQALQALESAPWYGNGLELHHRLQPLRAAAPGIIDLETLRAYLPDLFSPRSLAPIEALISPVRQPDGTVGGLRFSHHRGALLVGRVRHVDELRRHQESSRVAQWLEIIEGACEGAEPACLDVSLLGRLSRAHLLFTRDANGLAVVLMPGTHLIARAGNLTDDVEELRAGQHFSLGEAGEVLLESARGRVYLHLFVFSGPVSFEQYSERALRRAEAGRPQPGATLATLGTRQTGNATATPSRGLRVWELNAAEIEALTDMVASYEGGQFNRHILAALTTLEDRPACQQVHTYLQDAPRKAQYTVRLYEKPENQALRDQLIARFDALPDRDARIALLPAGLQRILEDP